MEKKKHSFPLSEVLMVTTGIVTGPRGILGLRGILAFMTGQGEPDHTSITDTGCQLLAPQCKQELIRQHPWLDGIQYQHVDPSNVDEWYDGIVREHGELVEVSAL